MDLLNTYKTGQWPKSSSGSGVSQFGGPLIKHGNVTYIFDPSAPSLGSRMIALDSELTPEEKQYYIERGTILSRVVGDTVLISGFDIDFPDNWTNHKLIATQSYYPDVPQEQNNGFVQDSLIIAPKQKAYICAALIELLIALADKIGFDGTFATSRAVITQEGDNQIGLDGSSSKVNSNIKNIISDHVFGRSFDFQKLGSNYDSTQNIPVSEDGYQLSLDMLLEALNTMPMPLLPDLIVIHPEVGRKLGIVEGLEGMSSAVKMKYPNLKYVDFVSDDNHTSHIHISFSAERAGKYIGSEGLIVSSTIIDEVDSGESDAALQAAIEVSRAKATINYKALEGDLSNLDVFQILTAKSFSPEVAAIFTAIMARESNRNPGSFNGVCSRNPENWNGLADDYSVGMFQFNLLSYINAKTGAVTKLPVVYDGTKYLDKPKMMKATHLAYKPGADANWTDTQILEKMLLLQNAGKAFVDDLLWYPVNQVALATYKWGANASDNVIKTSSGFHAWGDYGTRSECGFIFLTSFQEAVSVYLTTGNDIAILQEWVRKNLPKYNPKTAPYIEQWMSGTIFFSKKKKNTLIKSSKPIKYVPAAGASSGGSVIQQIDKKLLIIGNLNVSDSSTLITKKMGQTPWSYYKTIGKAGLRMATASAGNAALKTLIQEIQTLKTASGSDKFVPDAYIIATGATDALLGLDLTGLKNLIKLVMVEIGSKPTYWIDTYSASTNVDISQSSIFNQALEDLRPSYPNILINSSTLNWAELVVANESYLSESKRTLSSLGQEAYATLIETSANELANLIVPGSYSYGGDSTVAPTFTKDQIKEAAIWLRTNRMADWQTKTNKKFGCEGFANRLSAALGLFGEAMPEIFNDEWDGPTTTQVPTNLDRSLSAAAHYNKVKNRSDFFGPTTPKGKNPPKGYVVYWTGGTPATDDLGHNGISLGDGTYIDQNDGSPYKIIGSTVAGGFPGINYTYVGTTPTW
jgi:hypothetical protein